MKIGIVTLVSDNYGNKLQNYAVEQLLSEYGQVVTFSVEQREGDIAEATPLYKKLRLRYIDQVLRSRMMYLYDMTNAQRSTLGNLLYVMTHRRQLRKAKDLRHRKFQAFQKNFLHISDRTITHENCSEQEWIESYDLFVCGSDQIWNPAYGTTSDLAFLSFAKGRKIALAPSFGVSDIPEESKADFRKWLNGITALSVREEDGYQIIKALTGREAQVLLDPTMAIEPICWEAMACAPEKKLPEKYILTYFLGQVTKEYKNLIRQISKQTGLPVVSLFNIEEPEHYVFNPSEVLYAIAHASLVLTDSFHGSVFSILFKRDFLVFCRNEGGKSMHSRISNLLSKFELEDRLVGGACTLKPIEAERWDQIHKIIAAERQRTRDYLENAIGKE